MKRMFSKLLRCCICDYQVIWTGKVHTHRHCGARMHVVDYVRNEVDE